VSVGSNIGISIGVVNPDMPDGLMAVYIVQMWLGRLEFVAVFALLGYLVSLARGRAARERPHPHRRRDAGTRGCWSAAVVGSR
jgi:Trk-type K+ transport system membrane component